MYTLFIVSLFTTCAEYTHTLYWVNYSSSNHGFKTYQYYLVCHSSLVPPLIPSFSHCLSAFFSPCTRRFPSFQTSPPVCFPHLQPIVYALFIASFPVKRIKHLSCGLLVSKKIIVIIITTTVKSNSFSFYQSSV